MSAVSADHEPSMGKYNRGCRCEGCAEVKRSYMRALFADLATRPRSEVPHGTVGGYTNWKCRCEPCSVAHSRKLKAGKADRKARLDADPTVVEHGRVATYSGWGCRCEPCRTASRTYYADLRGSKEAASRP